MTSGPGSSQDISHPRAPMFTLSVALAAGILLAHYSWRPPIWIGTAAVATAISACLLLRGRPRSAWLVAHLAIGCLGWLSLVGQAGQQEYARKLADLSPFLNGQGVVIVARVTRIDGPQITGDHQQIDIETESLDDGQLRREVNAGLRLNLYGRAGDSEHLEPGNAPPTLAYGTRFRMIATLRPPRNFRNPGAWDYEGYLHRLGIAAIGSGKAASVEVLSSDSGDRFGRWRFRARQSVVERIHHLWPARQAALMDAMLIGERVFIDRDQNADFQRSGTYHVLVVSGMNVSILALVVFWLSRRLRASELLASIFTIALSLAYALLCDGGAPVIRATLMLAVFLIARLIYRGRSPLNAVGVAASAVLLLDPIALFDASFVMTFLCVVIIAGIGVPLLERTSDGWRRALRNFDLIAYDINLPPKIAQFRIDLRMIIARLTKVGPEPLWRFLILKTIAFGIAAWEVLLISALMQVGLVLPMAIYFHRLTVTAMPANVLVVPLTEILMPSAVGSVAISCLSESLAHIPALIAGWSLAGITGTVHAAGSLRIADVRIPTPSFWASVVAVSATVAAVALARRKRLVALASLGFLAASSITLALSAAHPQTAAGKFELTGIDVGQADSTLLVSPQGKALLVDAAGPLGFGRSEFDFGENVVSPYLLARGFSRVDVAVITHGHSDHIGGMKSIIENFGPRELWVGPLPPSDSVQSVLDCARDRGVRIVELRAGDQREWAGVQVRVLSPPRNYKAGDDVRNNDSLAIEFRYGNTSALLEGDAESRMEKTIAGENPSATVLKLAHNGSLTSTSPELLDAARPRYALISVGTRNLFHHPRPEILARLAQRQIATYRTDTMGAITFLLDGTSVHATTFRPDPLIPEPPN